MERIPSDGSTKHINRHQYNERQADSIQRIPFSVTDIIPYQSEPPKPMIFRNQPILHLGMEIPWESEPSVDNPPRNLHAPAAGIYGYGGTVEPQVNETFKHEASKRQTEAQSRLDTYRSQQRSDGHERVKSVSTVNAQRNPSFPRVSAVQNRGGARSQEYGRCLEGGGAGASA